MAEFSFTELLPLGHDDTTYRKIADGGAVAKGPFGKNFIEVDPEALTLLSRTAFRDIAHLLRPSHLRQLRSILDDPEASPNDRYVARDVPVVGRCLRVVQDGPQLPQVGGTEQVGNVPERRAAQQGKCLRVNFNKVFSERTLGYSSTVGDLPVRGVVVPEREQLGEGKLGHGPSLEPSGDRGRRDVGRVGSVI